MIQWQMGRKLEGRRKRIMAHAAKRECKCE